MSTNPGFSYPSNIIDTNESSYLNNSFFKKTISIVKLFPKIVRHKLTSSDNRLEKISISINFLNYQKILKDRRIAIHKGYIENPSYVSSVVNYKGNKYKAKIRLKGNIADHWRGKSRMSLRVKLDSGKTIFGFNTFSMQKPRARQYPYEQTFQEILFNLGNITAKYKFANVSVNSDEWGVMLFEEEVSKQFLEKQNRKDSLVFRFSNNKKKLKSNYKKCLDYRLSDDRLFLYVSKNKKYLKNLTNRKIYSYILERNINNKHVDIYSINPYIKVLALSIIWNNQHSILNSNLKHYFNPYTLKLEPITADQLRFSQYSDGFMKFVSGNKSNAEIYRQLQSLYLIQEVKKYMPEVINSLDDINKLLNKYKSIFPLDSEKTGKVIQNNINFINESEGKFYKQLLSGSRHEGANVNLKQTEINSCKDFPQYVHARHYSNGEIHIFNLLPYEVKIEGIVLNNKLIDVGKVLLPGHNNKDYNYIIIKSDIFGVQDYNIKIISSYKGVEKYTAIPPTLIKDVVNPLLTNTVDKFDFIDRVNGTQYEINPGNWTADSPIIIDGDLHIKPGVNIRFSKKSYLIVKGSLNAVGTEESPIVLDSKIDLWKGVYVINSNKDSYLNNVSFNNMSALEDGLLSLTGSVNFYKSNVTLENVEFNNIKAEDAINFVKSDFRMNSVVIKNAISDGLDSDFSNGEIHNSKFFDIGGDALDFSGSSIDIDGVIVENTKDKAISAGEGSDVYLTNSKFNNIGIGIASKDGSKVSASNVDISNYKLNGIMTYIKKDFYGVPSLKLNNSKITNGNKYLRQSGTFMTVDGLNVPEIRVNVKKLYKKGVMLK